MKSIPGYPSYLASKDGQIFSAQKGKFTKLKQFPDKDGYLKVQLRNPFGKARNFYVQRLMCLAYYGDPKPGDEACHQDGIRTHNAADNLRWGTKEENTLDKFRHGTSGKGESNPNAKLTWKSVRQIRADYARGANPHLLARSNDVSYTLIMKIINKKIWIEDA